MLDGVGWVPVDISEAWKDPKKHDYFFGTLDANRVQFTIGRDLTLQPKQNGSPLNYLSTPTWKWTGNRLRGSRRSFRTAKRLCHSPGSTEPVIPQNNPAGVPCGAMTGASTSPAVTQACAWARVNIYFSITWKSAVDKLQGFSKTGGSCEIFSTSRCNLHVT